MSGGTHRHWFAAAAVLLGAAAALLLTEGLLRLSGERPWHFAPIDPHIPVTNEPDPVLGWRPKPGVYDVPPFSPRGHVTRVTVLEDRSRATGSRPAPGRPTLLLVGGSFAFGWAVSDADTFAWKLNQALPAVDVVNHGVSGYGTYQSLLTLEQLLENGFTPSRVLYGYLEGHEFRNVAHPLWTLSLTKYSTHGMVAVPYALLDEDGHLQRRPPTRYPSWPLRDRLALVSFLERKYVMLTQSDRTAAADPVTDAILREMARLCSDRGIEFDMVILHGTDEATKRYIEVLQPLHARVIDCSFPLLPKYRVRGDGHPNALLHSEWAACIADALQAPPPSAGAS